MLPWLPTLLSSIVSSSDIKRDALYIYFGCFVCPFVTMDTVVFVVIIGVTFCGHCSCYYVAVASACGQIGQKLLILS